LLEKGDVRAGRVNDHLDAPAGVAAVIDFRAGDAVPNDGTAYDFDVLVIDY
jgi:hypothetical protein